MLMTEWNWDDALAVRFEEGIEKGIEKGREEGMEKGIEKTARKLKSMGLSFKQIAEATGLLPKDIERL